MMPRTVCSFGGERSWTDIGTNHTHMERLDDSFPYYIEHGVLPANVLPTFLHEATHHSCLNRVVGRVLAVLEGECLILEDARHVAIIQNRIDLTFALLRPWMEGLALYAEFDVTPSSTIRSGPMAGAIRMFLPRKSRDRPALVNDLFRLLVYARSTIVGVERKKNLLASPWRGDEVYLPGYCAVKSVARHLIELLPDRFDDSDLVLSYLISHTFDDIVLAEMLLNHADPASIAERFKTRLFHAIWRDDLSDAVDRMVESFSAPDDPADPGRLALVGALDRNQDQVAAFVKQAETRIDPLPDRTKDSLARFPIMHVISIPVLFAPADNDQIALRVNGIDHELLTTPLRPPHGDSGFWDIYFDAQEWDTQAYLSDDHGLLDGPSGAGTAARLLTRSEVMEQRENDLAILARKLAQTNYPASVDRTLREWTAYSVRVLESIATAWLVKVENYPRFLEQLREKGFASVFSEEDLLALALVSSLDANGTLLEETRIVGRNETIQDIFASLDERLVRAFGATPFVLVPASFEGVEGHRVLSHI